MEKLMWEFNNFTKPIMLDDNLDDRFDDMIDEFLNKEASELENE